MTTTGCLVLHGFAGDVQEVEPLARALYDAGYAVECPTLDGHGLGRRELARSTRHDWIRSAEEAFKRLSMRADRIVVIGFSMGGLLAFQLAVRHPVSLLVTINTPFRYWDLGQAAAYLREDFALHSRRYVRSFLRIPLASMLQFRLLLAETKRILPQVTCPYRLLQSRRDDTVKAASAEHLLRAVGSTDTAVSYYPRSGHLLLLGPEANEAIAWVKQAIREHLENEPPGD